MPNSWETSPPSPPIQAFRFAATGAAASVVGYFVDGFGFRVGASFSQSIPATGPAVALTAPAKACGAVLSCPSGTVAYSPGDDDGDLRANVGRYPTLTATPARLGQMG